MTTTLSTATDHPSPPSSIPTVIDLTTLSQSDLYTLSQSSSSSFDLQNDVVIPKINHNVFNESAGSRKQTYSRFRLPSAVHRRTHHLRGGSHTLSLNDPEQAENTQIINILKHFCKSNNSLEFHDIDKFDNNNSVELAEFLNSEKNRKRKRGRPRKHENVVFIRPPNKRVRNSGNGNSNNGFVKKEVVYDVERDKGVLNEKGVVVDLGKLSGLDNPYGAEITRRTVGMGSEDELLGFLRGLNGQWGSRRRKRRVVDASEFGDVLPKGWKLSLCIKKKEGRIWLFVRRYLSPSGRQFESCKDISSYMMSIIGEENLEKQNHVNINSSEYSALKGPSVNDVDLVLQEDTKIDGPIDHPSSSLSPSPSSSSSPTPSSLSAPPVPANCEEQVTLDAMEVVAGGDVKNDHMGCNVKNEREKTEPSVVLVSEMDCDPVLMTGVPNRESLISVSVGDNVVIEADDIHSGEMQGPASPCDLNKRNSGDESDTDGFFSDLNIESHSKHDGHTNADINNFIEESCDMNDEVSRPDQVSEAAVSQSELLGDEVLFSIDERNRKPDTSGEMRVDCGDIKSDCNLDQVVNSGNVLHSSSPVEQGGHGIGTGNITLCATDEVLNQDTGSATSVGVLDPVVSETGIPTKTSICDEKSVDTNRDMDIGNASHDSASEKDRVFGESSSGFFLDRFGLDKDEARVAEKLSTRSVDNLSHGTYNDVNKPFSGMESSGLDGQFNVGTITFGSSGAASMEGMAASEEESDLNKTLGSDLPFSSMDEPMIQITSESSLLLSGGGQAANKSEETNLEDFDIFRNNDEKHNESGDVLGFNKKSNLEFCSLVPSENEHAFGFQDDVTSLYENTMDECKEESSERGLLDHFSDDIFENKMYSTPLDGLKFDADRDLNSNELSLAFGNPHVSSKMEEAFDVHTNLSMVNSSMVDDLKVGRGSMGGLFNLSSNIENSSFHNAWEGIKPDAFKNSGNKFTTGFGSNHGETHKEFKNSGNKFTTGFESNHDQTHKEFKNVGNKFSSGFGSNQSQVHQEFKSSGNNFSAAFGSNHGQPRQEYQNSGNKFTSGFGSNHGQPHQEVVPSGMWRTGDLSQLQSNTSHAEIPSSSSFHSFNIMPDKAPDGQFRLDGRYSEGFGLSGLRSGRPEPVEFSFLTGRSQHNPLPIQGDPRIFSYNPPMEQQFDSNFWLGKNTMMPNQAGRNQMTCLCPWCGNEFHLHPGHSVTQGGMGPLCPTCSARVSGRVNML
uniref:uncharacterized protein LOC122608051 n=1 Tax=Erigeron canadensis TaxID=72917 RepID=UPI001CB8CBE2|nr:uncharacterized protein LOC122608051 [Erigeron canadensis]